MDLRAHHDWAYPLTDVTIDETEGGVLGRGAYGTVRVALWNGVRVAAKQLHALSLGDADGEERELMSALVREMSVLSQLRHPNLVLFLGVSFDPATATPQAILTELLPHSLYDLLETKKMLLSVVEVCYICNDIASALAFLHGRSPPVVHRDLSARNVLIDRQGRAKVADLGQAKVLGGTHHSHSRNSSMPGAMAYAAPEVLTGRYHEAIDLFSFGVLLAQCITGEFPRIDKREQQVASRPLNISQGIMRRACERSPVHVCVAGGPRMRRRPCPRVLAQGLPRAAPGEAAHGGARVRRLGRDRRAAHGRAATGARGDRAPPRQRGAQCERRRHHVSGT